jgi:hypothetical protein
MSTLNVSNISDGTDTVETGYVVNGSAKAWVSVNQQGTMAVLDSQNVASIVDHGTGATEVNFSNAMANANYTIASVVRGVSGVANCISELVPSIAPTSSQYRIAGLRAGSSNSNIDVPNIYGNTFGDLA